MPDDLENQEPLDETINDGIEFNDGADNEDDFDFTGLTDEEIAAINATDDNDEVDSSDVGDGDVVDSSTDDSTAELDADEPDASDDGDSGDAEPAADDWKREADTVAQRRTTIDADFDAKLTELEELGKKYDEGDIYDGAYNAQKARIEREIKRIEAREAELVTKEDAIEAREVESKQQDQNEFQSAVGEFMALPENSVFVEGSTEFAALDQQLGVIASAMPPGTPFDVLLGKARTVVASYMELPEVAKTNEAAPEKPKQQEGTMPSISSMPAVVPNSNDGNKYAHLDKLGGPELERALADMSDEQQTEYLTQG